MHPRSLWAHPAWSPDTHHLTAIPLTATLQRQGRPPSPDVEKHHETTVAGGQSPQVNGGGKSTGQTYLSA